MTTKWSDTIQAVQAQTIAALADGTSAEFFPTLTRIAKDEVRISLLLNGCGTSDGMLAAVERLGFKGGQRNLIPDFVFFAAEVVVEEGETELIMLSGCSNEFEVLVCYLSFERDSDQMIHPIGWSLAGPVAKERQERVPAYRAMRAAIARANAPWWKSWF